MKLLYAFLFWSLSFALLSLCRYALIHMLFFSPDAHAFIRSPSLVKFTGLLSWAQLSFVWTLHMVCHSFAVSCGSVITYTRVLSILVDGACLSTLSPFFGSSSSPSFCVSQALAPLSLSPWIGLPWWLVPSLSSHSPFGSLVAERLSRVLCKPWATWQLKMTSRRMKLLRWCFFFKRISY